MKLLIQIVDEGEALFSHLEHEAVDGVKHFMGVLHRDAQETAQVIELKAGEVLHLHASEQPSLAASAGAVAGVVEPSTAIFGSTSAPAGEAVDIHNPPGLTPPVNPA